MIKKALAFVACILAAFSANAQSQTKSVTKGEHQGATSTRFHQNISLISAITPRANLNKMRIGVVLHLSSNPGLTESRAASAAAGKPTTSTASGFQQIKAGAHDNDYTIARRFDTSAKVIRQLNPEIVWNKLRPGAKVRVPASNSTVASTSGSAAQTILTTGSLAKPLKKAIAAKAPAKAPVVKTVSAQTYVATREDNDWIIARKFGLTPPAIRAANPEVEWSRLRPGRKIVIPGVSGKAALAVLEKRKGITTHYAMLRGDNVNVRSGARTSAESILQVDGGTPVVIIDRMNNWYKLKFPHGTKGWVRGDMLEPAAKRPKAFLAYQKQNDDPQPVYATRTRRQYDDEDRPSLKRRVQETRVASRRHAAEARHAYPPPSRRDRSQDTMAYSAEGGEGVISAARSMLGVRYRYGAESRNATDCSGFTQQTYRKEGVRLPRTAHEQYGVGKSVTRNDLKPGDLVFFHTTSRGVSHVGIYKGNNEFIHASSGKGHVTISKLDGYYARRYVGARRVKSSSSKSSSSGSSSSKKKPTLKQKIKFSVD